MSKESPTKRTLAEARKLGFLAHITEKWNPHAKIRQDMLGCIDLILIREGIGIIGVQATSRTNHAARRTKAISEPRLRIWLQSGGRFEVWSWAKMGAVGKRKLWQCWREEITLADLPAEPPEQEASAVA